MEDDSNSRVFGLFYDMLKDIRASKVRNPEASSRVVRDGEQIEKMLEGLQSLNIPFSGEENCGRYLDLHEFYFIFINAKFGYRLTYADYLDIFPAIDDDKGMQIPSKYKRTTQFKEYITGVLDYLVSFLDRTEPLFLDRLFKDLESEFEGRWTVGQKRPRTMTMTTSDVMEQLDGFNTVESLIELGSVSLKEALDTLGLKSGGTVQQKAERLLLVKNTPLDRLQRRHFKKETGADDNNQCHHDYKATALVEAKVKKLCEILNETLERTRQHVKNRQGMTARELAYERETNTNIENSNGEDDDEINANCKKLPLGWDGKPIPYWLYKLHGLEQQFNCEICGSYNYYGRRAFEKHFYERRHQYGMSYLGIPNNKCFHEITSIEDARNLWKNVQIRQGDTQRKSDIQEECEDSQGNIYSKKIFNDLFRQGLVS